MVHNKQVTLTILTVEYTLPFCIAPCSVPLFGPAVAEHDLVHESDDNALCLSLSFLFFSWYTVNVVAGNI